MAGRQLSSKVGLELDLLNRWHQRHPAIVHREYRQQRVHPSQEVLLGREGVDVNHVDVSLGSDPLVHHVKEIVSMKVKYDVGVGD